MMPSFTICTLSSTILQAYVRRSHGTKKKVLSTLHNDQPKKRTWNSRGGTTAAILVDSGHVALETPRPGLGKLGHVAQIVEHRLEDDIGVVLPCRAVQ